MNVTTYVRSLGQAGQLDSIARRVLSGSKLRYEDGKVYSFASATVTTNGLELRFQNKRSGRVIAFFGTQLPLHVLKLAAK